MKKIFYVKVFISLISMVIVCDASIFKNSYISFGFYNHFGSIALRKLIPKPLAFSTSRKSDKSFVLSWRKNIKSFFKDRLQLNIGLASTFSYLKADDIQNFSLFPELKYIFFNHLKLDPFISWSIAGITYLDKNHFGNEKIAHYLFQDYISFGIQYRMVNLSMSFLHYSGGNILTNLSGYDVPFIITLGLGLT